MPYPLSYGSCATLSQRGSNLSRGPRNSNKAIQWYRLTRWAGEDGPELSTSIAGDWRHR